MRPRWSNTFAIATLEEDWERKPTTPGIYIIMREKLVRRIGGADPSGILYIGKAFNLRERLSKFWNADHIASDLMRMQLPLACSVLGCNVETEDELYPALSRLRARVATPLRKSDLDGAERAVLMAYMLRFGELPPLNFSMRGRWDGKPGRLDLRWATRGIDK
jgi:hypothetical protein